VVVVAAVTAAAVAVAAAVAAAGVISRCALGGLYMGGTLSRAGG
jgi:hypothetical protein